MVPAGDEQVQLPADLGLTDQGLPLHFSDSGFHEFRVGDTAEERRASGVFGELCFHLAQVKSSVLAFGDDPPFQQIGNIARVSPMHTGPFRLGDDTSAHWFS